MKRSILFFMLMTAVSLYGYGQQTNTGGTTQLLAGQWSVEKANDWYAKQAWIVGCNFVPSTAVNDVEIWQDETFDLPTIDKELGLARAWGINSVRVFLNYVVWEAEAKKFKSNFRKFLDVAGKHGISVMPVLFDDCNFSGTVAKVGKQPDAGKDFCLGGWVSSPPVAMIRDKAQWEKLKAYEQDMIRTFGKDKRIIIWDLYNEPNNGNSKDGNKAELLKNVFAWAREMKPAQPLTVGAWSELGELGELMRSHSDIVSFHAYDGKSKFEQRIEWAKETGRPAVCTEWLHRPQGNTVAEILPVLKETKTGGYLWGLVNGKTQTHAQWGSTPQKPIVGIWQHDLMHNNGTVYNPSELHLFRTLAGNFVTDKDDVLLSNVDRQLKDGQWSIEKANDWYAKQALIVGCNFVPSTAINDVEMWQDETFDLPTIDRELGLAGARGINSVRVFLNYVVWEAEAETFKSNFGKFLDVAGKHGISVMPVLFDDCNFSDIVAKVGKQSGAGRDFCLCAWVSSPPRALVRDKSQWQKLKEYEQNMIRTFGSDRRIIIWDLYSEPGNSSSGLNAELLENIFAWAREMNPSQPLTVGVWNQFDEFTRRSSDIVSFHRYANKSDFEQKIKWAKETGRPAICTEWLHRPDENTVAEILPVLKETKTGGYFWGPVNGKTQTYAQCGSTPQKPAVLSGTGGAADLELLAGNGLGNVDVATPYLVNAARIEIPYLLEFDMDRMLYRFREQAGLDTKGASPYNASGESWYAGHFTGHYLSAVSQAYAGTTATVRQKAQLSQRLTAIVDGVREAQLAYAAKDPANAGFLPAFAVTSVPNGEAPGGAPFYSLHKELQGLVNVYQYSPDQATRDKALAAAGDFARWVINWRAAHPAADILRVEYGGINEGLYNLFEITGNPIHAQAAHLFDEETVFQRLANGEDPLPEPDPHYGACGHHANAIVPTLIGAARRYTLYMSRPEYYLPVAEKLKLETLYRPAAENFFDIVVNRHTYANGGHAQGEFFHEPDQLWYDATQRNGVHGRDASSTSETCGTYNMLKLARLLFQATGDVKYSEYYERAFVNQMVGSQHPETATTTYFQPMAAGFAKLFFGLPKPVFFCCEGSSLETFTKLNGSLYFTDGENLWVNMFFASTFRDTRHKLVLTATGDVPKQDAMTYTVTSKSQTPLAGVLIP